jgi:hypothetical protein
LQVLLRELHSLSLEAIVQLQEDVTRLDPIAFAERQLDDHAAVLR